MNQIESKVPRIRSSFLNRPALIHGVYMDVVCCDVTGFYRSHLSTMIWATFHSAKLSVYLNVWQRNLATSSDFCRVEFVGETSMMIIFHFVLVNLPDWCLQYRRCVVVLTTFLQLTCACTNSLLTTGTCNCNCLTWVMSVCWTGYICGTRVQFRSCLV